MKYALLVITFFSFAPLSKAFAKPTHTFKSTTQLLASNDNDDDDDLFMDDADEAEGQADDADIYDDEAAAPAEPEQASKPEPAPAPAEQPAPQHVAEPTPPPAAPMHKKMAPHKMKKHASHKRMHKKKRRPASFRQGFKTLSEKCELHASPNKTSQVLLSTPAGKKLWLEGHNANWYKAYHKGGFGYFSADCFQ